MIGEFLKHQKQQSTARVISEPFPHYLGNDEEGKDQVVLVEYTSGPSAEQIDVIPVDHLLIYWRVQH